MSPQHLDQTLIDLASGVIDMAGDAPVQVTQIAADLPMEFSLDRRNEITARPPFALQTRDLALPVARMSVTFDLSGGGHV